MKAFFRATEVWTPTADRQHLDLTAGLYSDMPYFEAVSRGMRLKRDEGLPGRAWTAGHPVILKNLANSYFRRGDAAVTEGLSCAIALPIFGEDGLTAVLVLFFGDNRYQRGAVEIWHAPAASPEMILVDGYFGRTEGFGAASRTTNFGHGAGIPGKVWETDMPVIIADVAGSGGFARQDSAQQFAIHRGLGIPCSARDAGNWVLTFLSVRNSPIARRFECWTPDAQAGKFRFAGGYCEIAGSLEAYHAQTDVSLATGMFAEMSKTGVPVICHDLGKTEDSASRAASQAGLAGMVAIPIFAHGTFKAVFAWYL